MKLFSFCILTMLALLYAGLTVVETVTYRKWELAVNVQKDVQAKVVFFQNMNRVIENLVRRMAYDSQHDPALAQLLKDKKIKVVVVGGQTSVDADNAISNAVPLTPTTPQPSDKLAPTPANTPASHP